MTGFIRTATGLLAQPVLVRVGADGRIAGKGERRLKDGEREGEKEEEGKRMKM